MDNYLIKNKMKKWLNKLDDNNRSLYRFIDKISYEIVDDLEANGLKINIPLFVLKQRIALFIFKNSVMRE